MPQIKRKEDLADIQQQHDGFPQMEIKKVGIHGVQVPLKVLRKDNTVNASSAEVSIYTNLNSKVKGANMSRYRIIVEEHLIGKDLNLREYLRTLLETTSKKLEATDSYVKIKFDYFLVRTAPASKLKSYLNYKCCVEGKHKTCDGDYIDDKGIHCSGIHDVNQFFLTVEVPYTSLCPCSKEISDYGAHNQRSFAKVMVELIPEEMCWIEDLIEIVESTASAPIVNGLKRVDEAYQTEKMYENPMFVEDMARGISERLNHKLLDKTISDYSIVITHCESIHVHDCQAIITAGRKLQ